MNSSQQSARSFILRYRAARQWTPVFQPNGICSSTSLPRKRHVASTAVKASQAEPEAPLKPFYVTTPIYYVNASPHAGHLYSMVLADVLKRWHQLKGDPEAYMLTGTDEHGMKVQKAAQQAKSETKLFCDSGSNQFRELADAANISYDRFMRTTDEDHKTAVEHFWTQLNHQGWIYESKHEGWYSVSDETFYPESQIHMVLDPSTGRKLSASKETGKEVQWTSEINYHFKLSQFKERLLKFYEENPSFVVPSERMNFVVKEVSMGLSDLSVSRPASRLSWGIPVPGDDSQTIYVWLDALINYITAAGYPKPRQKGDKWLWPPECQVIGKDIIRFHCIYWPAFLMALDLPIPKKFLSHAHWTMNQEKMSKSLGNVVDPFFAMERFGVDTIRYYMVRDGGIVDDSPYENSFIIERYKKDLQNGFGNMVGRITRSKAWSVRSIVEEVSEGRSDPPGWYDDWRTFVDSQFKQCENAMANVNPRDASAKLIEIIYATNKMFHYHEVWTKAASEDLAEQDKVKWPVFAAADALRLTAIAMQPMMPEKMKRALDLLGVEEGRRTLKYASMSADNTFGAPLVDVGRGYEGMLFPPLTSAY